MKKALFSLSVLLVTLLSGFNLNAQETVSLKKGAVIEMDKEIHDYGTIKQNADPFCFFEIKNTGSEPLIISKAKGSCGCTLPTYDKSPILPGETRKLKVRYDTNRTGNFQKNVTITSNAVNAPTKVIRIKGNVTPKPTAGAPVKTVGPISK